MGVGGSGACGRRCERHGVAPGVLGCSDELVRSGTAFRLVARNLHIWLNASKGVEAGRSSGSDLEERFWARSGAGRWSRFCASSTSTSSPTRSSREKQVLRRRMAGRPPGPPPLAGARFGGHPRPASGPGEGGGDEGTRTPYLSDANAALSQMSYVPTPRH